MLRDVLSGVYGFPDEYLNPELIADSCMRHNVNSASDYMDALIGLRTTTNGVFGIEVTSEHIDVIGEGLFFQKLANPRVILLYRKNIVAQGISLYRAVSTGFFHSKDGSVSQHPQYDASKVERWIRYVVNVEAQNVLIVQRRGLRLMSISYEELVSDVSSAVRAIGIFLEVDFPHDAEVRSSFNVVSDHWNIDVEERFRAERPEFVEEILHRRQTAGPASLQC